MRRVSQGVVRRTIDLEEDATFADPTARCAAPMPFDTVLDMHDQLLRSGATTGQIVTRRVSPCYSLETTGAHILHYSVHVEDERMTSSHVPTVAGSRSEVPTASGGDYSPSTNVIEHGDFAPT